MSDQQPASSDPDVPSEGPAPDAVPAPPVEPPAPPVEPPVWPAAAPPTAQVPPAPPVPPYTPPPGGMYAPAPAYPPAPAYAAAPSTSSNAIIALVLSILSWVVCPLVPAIIALVFANMATKEIDASGGRVGGQGMVTASKIVSWINIGLYAAAIVVGGFLLVLFAIAGASN